MQRILLIEDDDQYRALLRKALEEAQYEVIEAPDGMVGLQRYRQNSCALVVTDIFMPEKEGLETIMELRKITPGVKIIAISGGGLRGKYAGIKGANLALESAKHFGADCVLLKPLN